MSIGHTLTMARLLEATFHMELSHCALNIVIGHKERIQHRAWSWTYNESFGGQIEAEHEDDIEVSKRNDLKHVHNMRRVFYSLRCLVSLFFIPICVNLVWER